MEKLQPNLAETLAKELKTPIEIASNLPAALRRVALPPGWSLEERDEEHRLTAPRRKHALVRLKDVDSFIDYVKRHGSLTDCTIWCQADYLEGKVSFTGIINDNGSDPGASAWRDHRALFSPEFSTEWRRWTGRDKQAFSQAEFAAFLEENLKDIASVHESGMPTGAEMLQMALQFEANQDMRFKSAVRLQNGGVSMQFVQDDDDQTLAKMQMFERFAIGIPVFWNGDAYQVDARLRYRVRDGKLSFWFELIRTDKILESASATVIQTIREKTGNPFFFGDAFAG
ncbi:DUF2303 family protein [Burkholderia sp. Ax-1719]|uniref:DUF2303 family protein n=1 Tax=Burkholderia sp. Ax-1719 TaxID=2608334 RepID=UPI001423CD6E|nr:DUF2303 family protein [Burkholderia sp. Ax-1719]NIE67442.1 DUF2303 family protein [Burkholderia sp. Ax-1719]